MNAIKVDKLDTPMYTPRSPYNPKFTPPQSQDAFGLEMGHYDHRPHSYMMDGIFTAKNVMSDQISNHTNLVVKELKENKEFMDKVDSKLGQMKKELQKIQKEKDDKKEDEMTKQTETIVKEQRQIYGLLAEKFKEVRQKIDEKERNANSFNPNLMTKMKKQNDKIVSAVIKLLEKVQEERDGSSVTTPIKNSSSSSSSEQKRKGVCFICQNPRHYAPDYPNKKDKNQRDPTTKEKIKDIMLTTKGKIKDIRKTKQLSKGNKTVVAITAVKQDTGPPNANLR